MTTEIEIYDMKTIKRNNGNDIKIYATTLEDVAFEQIKELG